MSCRRLSALGAAGAGLVVVAHGSGCAYIYELTHIKPRADPVGLHESKERTICSIEGGLDE